jgi:hypothetical protein
MTKFLAVCLGVMLGVAPAPRSFALAERVGNPVGFFVFEIPVGKFVIRRDGMGEIYQSGGRRHVFFLKGAGKDSFDRIYFLEHEGDVLLFYELRDGTAQLVRFDPVKRRVKWMTPVTTRAVPSLEDGMVVIETMKIRAADGETIQRS